MAMMAMMATTKKRKRSEVLVVCVCVFVIIFVYSLLNLPTAVMSTRLTRLTIFLGFLIGNTTATTVAFTAS